MNLKLKGKRAVVMGGSRGIGRAIADLLADEGADLAICARKPDQVTEAVASLQAKGINAYGATVDIADGPALPLLPVFCLPSGRRSVSPSRTSQAMSPVLAFTANSLPHGGFWQGMPIALNPLYGPGPLMLPRS